MAEKVTERLIWRQWRLLNFGDCLAAVKINPPRRRVTFQVAESRNSASNAPRDFAADGPAAASPVASARCVDTRTPFVEKAVRITDLSRS
jgi:hypothetical protein